MNRSLLLSLSLAMLSPLTAFSQTEYRQLTNLPTVYIDTENKVSIPDKNSPYVNCTLRYVDANGVKTYENTSIKGRGNSTWNFAKKPYKVKFEKKQKFLGDERANAKSWTFLANHADKTLIRNAVAAFIGDFAGQPFTAAAQFADLVVNGEYLGSYQISDQVEVRKKRVDIVEQEETPTGSSNISGGYLLEVDGFADSEKSWFKTSRGVKVTIKSPDEDIIGTSQSQFIKNYYQEFEDALFSTNWKDPEKGYRKYIDEETLASWYVATELTGNVDGFWSTYMYKQQDDPKLYWGPLWDYDIAFNNCDRVGNVHQRMMKDASFGQDLTGVWVQRMWQDPWFSELIKTKWQDCLDRGIEEKTLAYIDQLAKEMEESQALNFSKWGISNKVYNEIVLFSTYKEGIDYMKSYIQLHVDYMTRYFNGLNVYRKFECEDGAYYRIYNKGTVATVGHDAAGVGMWNSNYSDRKQEWKLTKTGDYYRIVNRESGEAVTDMAVMNGSNYAAGSRLGLKPVDESDQAQEWEIKTVLDGCYVIANRKTGLAWNNNGGGTAQGNAVISWTNDSQNSAKQTRQWMFTKAYDKSAGVENIPTDDLDYTVTYDRNGQSIRFHGELPADGVVELYSLNGMLEKREQISDRIDISDLPAGIHLLRWTISGTSRSLKFVK